MWAFKSLYDKGLVYEGFSVLAYCWRCETPLSNTETRMDDVYQDRQDPALTVGFQLETGEKLLVWTTTPWTLPSNLAVAVGPTSTTRSSNAPVTRSSSVRRASVRTPRNSPTTSRSVRSRAAKRRAERLRHVYRRRCRPRSTRSRHRVTRNACGCGGKSNSGVYERPTSSLPLTVPTGS